MGQTIDALHAAAQDCRDCPLYKGATQVVFGEGPTRAKLMLLGEQPGDREDRAGHPFVGPAGALLDQVLDEAGIDRDDVYLTNAVKHFKWVRGHGKVRIHKSPSRSEVAMTLPSTIEKPVGWFIHEFTESTKNEPVNPAMITGTPHSRCLFGSIRSQPYT